MISCVGDGKRKGLPKWLREELEKMEKKRLKNLEKEAQALARQEEEARNRPAWRDQESDEEEEVSKTKKLRGRSYRPSRSSSPVSSDT